jgi:hypothetical protein
MDWTFLITIAAIVGVIANIKKKKWCFIIWIFTNAAWCVYDYSIGAYWQSVLFLVYFLLAIWGLIEWCRGEVNKHN